MSREQWEAISKRPRRRSFQLGHSSDAVDCRENRARSSRPSDARSPGDAIDVTDIDIKGVLNHRSIRLGRSVPAAAARGCRSAPLDRNRLLPAAVLAIRSTPANFDPELQIGIALGCLPAKKDKLGLKRQACHFNRMYCGSLSISTAATSSWTLPLSAVVNGPWVTFLKSLPRRLLSRDLPSTASEVTQHG